MMLPMPSSPHTPSTRRRSSMTDMKSSPQSIGYSPIQIPRSRKSSLHSMYSPATPRPGSSHDRNKDFGTSTGSGGPPNPSNGLGSLADELAEAFDEDGEEEEVSGLLVDETENESIRNSNGEEHMQTLHEPLCGLRISSPNNSSPTQPSVSSSKASTNKSHKTSKSRKTSNQSDSDSDSEAISASLAARFAIVESLAQLHKPQSSEISHLTTALQTLPSQSAIETRTTRLTTTHTTLTTYIHTETRHLQTLLSTILSPLVPPPPPSHISTLLPTLTALPTCLPKASPLPPTKLAHLHTSTLDLIDTLSALSDSLHMTRQTSLLGARRLRATRELVASFRQEMEERDEAIRWLEEGRWEERLKGRECKRECEGVVRGFEDFCDGWRRRLGGEVEVEVVGG